MYSNTNSLFRIRSGWLLLVIICLGIQVHGQEIECPQPCKIDLRYDLPIATTGGLIGLAGFIMSKKQITLTEERINSLDKNDVNKFDRSAIGNDSDLAGKISDGILYTSFVSPLALLGSKNVRASWKEFTLMMGESYLLTMGLTILTKELTDRPRPFLYDENFPIEDKIGSSQDNSFFSGHTSVVATSMFFTAKIFSDYHPDSKWKPAVWTVAATVPALTGYLRYADGKHFFTDVIAGYAVGAFVGTMVPFAHRKIKERLDRKEQLRGPTGYFEFSLENAVY